MEHTHLHHIDLPNYYQFVTFRTHDSVDSYLRKMLSSTIQENVKQQAIDNHLDKSNKGSYLNHKVLKYLFDFFIAKDKGLYELIAFCIMPNHVHLLFKPLSALPILMKNIKGSSAFEINKILGKKGVFWAAEYFDKLIRNEEHFNIVYSYIKNNPRNLAKEKDKLPRFYGIYE